MKHKGIGLLADAAAVVVLLALVTLLWYTPYLPLQDFPEWVFQGRLVGDALAGNLPAAAGYTVAWFPPPPDIAVSALLGLLGLVMPALMAGRLVVVLIALVFVSGWWYFFTRINADNPFRWAGLLFACGYFFYMGFLSYVLGLGILFYALGWLLSGRARSAPEMFVGTAALSVALYVVHGIAWGIFLIALCIDLLRGAGQAQSGKQKLGILAATTPSLVLLALYVPGGTLQGGIGTYPSVFEQLINWRYGVMFFQRFEPFEQSLPLSLLNVGVWIVLAGFWIAVVWGKRPPKIGRVHLTLAVVLLILTLGLPFSHVNGLYSPNQRFIVPALAVLMAGAGASPAARARGLVVPALGLLTVCVQANAVADFNASATEITDVIAPVWSQSASPLYVGRCYVDEFDKRPLQVISGPIRTTAHFRRYFEVDRVPAPSVTFETALVRATTPDAAHQLVTVDSLLQAAQRTDEALAVLRGNLTGIRQNADFVFVVGGPGLLEGAQGVLEPYYRVRELDDNVLVLQRRP